VNTRPCVCQGSNENCRYCAGRGYVEDITGLPASIGQKQLNVSGYSVKRVERWLLPCPICGVPVGKLRRHLNRRHRGIDLGAVIHDSEKNSEISLNAANTAQLHATDSPPSEQPAHPVPNRPALNANSAAGAGNQPKHDLKPAAGGVRCPRCLELFDNRDTLRKHVYGNCNAAPKKVGRQIKLVTCPGCGTLVQKARLKRHLARCPSKRPGRSNKELNDTTARPLWHARNPVAKKPSPLSTWAELNSRDRLDHTKGYAHPCRESGKYGSHSMHDGFDDESGPD